SPVARPEDAPAALAALAEERAARRAEPVAVAWEGAGEVELTLPAGAARRGRAVEAELELEAGGTRRWRRALDRLPSGGASGSGVEGAPIVEARRLRLPARLPWGYHRLRLDVGGGEAAEVRVIAAPRRAWAGEERPEARSLRQRLARSVSGGAAAGGGEAAREWGVFLPLYALRREEGDLGVGDLTGLEELGRWIGGLGGTTVATLPLLAAFLGDGSLAGPGPFEPSPYAPASRLFWNELWIDPRRLPELADSPEAQRLLASPDFAREAAQLAAGRFVDYRHAYALRRRVLALLAGAFFAAAPPGRRAELDALLARRPELADYAAFRAVGESRKESWHSWPEPLRSGTIGEGEGDEAARRFHLYVQLAADRQLAEVGAALAAAAPGGDARGGLYLDLPLGVHPDSYDAWRHRDLFATAVSAGAPPDDFFVRGQDWGFQPIHPERSRHERHAHWRAVVRHHLAHAAWLRLDHVMQLHRLWWVPHGLAPTDGAYVRYPADELTAVLTLESHRAGARLVGENLGTVPGFVNRALERHGIARMFVLPFEIDREGGSGGLHRPAAADTVASVNTHDMPTFHAFWSGADVADRADLGLLDEAAAGEERRRRGEERQAWRRGLERSGHLAAGEEDPHEVLSAALASLGASDAALVLANLEDLWGEVEPQNTPGTSSERPNWRRRARLTLEEMRREPRVAGALARLAAARRGGAARVPMPPPAAWPAVAGTELARERGEPHRDAPHEEATTPEGT
ncbi:MAG TPA: 4-alpha-glucanotransferase, partial [Thermoanaerobaculia bacterium]